jgi:CSLREA domain-containing protein
MLVSSNAQAGTMTVNSTADTNSADNVLTLREAILLSQGGLSKSSLTGTEQAQVSGTVGVGIQDTIIFSGSMTILAGGSILPSLTDASGTIIDATGLSVTIDGQNSTVSSINGLKISGGGNNTIRGLKIEKFGTSGSRRDAIRLQKGTKNNLIINNIIIGTYRGIYATNGDNNTFEGNDISSLYRTAMQLTSGSTGNIIRKNVIHRELVTSSTTAGLYLSTSSSGNSIYLNTIRDNPRGIRFETTSGTTKIYHNTFDGNYRGIYTTSGAIGMDVRNNIFSNNTNAGIYAGSTAGTINYNDFFANGSGGTVHCTNGCSIGANSITTNPLYVNQGANNFILTATSPAINTGIDLGVSQPDVNGSSAGLYNGSAPDMGAFETSVSGVAAKFVFTTGAPTATAGVASGTITIQLQDGFSVPVNASAGGQLVFLASTSSGTVTFAPASPVTIPAGSSSVDITYTDTKSGSPTITASDASPPNGDTGLTDATQTATVNPAAPIKLIYTTASQAATAGVPSGTITVSRQDSFSNPTTSGVLSVTLSSSSTGTVTFTPASPVSIAAGASSVNFTYTDTLAAVHTITASASGLTNGEQTIAVYPGSSILAFTTSPQTTITGTPTGTITVRIQDSFNNPINAGVGGQAVHLTTNSTGVISFSPSASLTIPSGSSSVNFTYTDTRVGTPWTITASDGSPPNGATGLPDATQSVTVNVAPASQLAFTTAPQTATAGVATVTMTIQLQDFFSNGVNAGAGGQVVHLTSNSSGTVTFTPASPLTIPSGSSSVNFTYTDTFAGGQTITASDGSPPNGAIGLTDGSQPVTIDPAAATKLIFTTPPKTTTAGAPSTPIIVQMQDTYNNPVDVTNTSGQSVNLSSATGGTPTFNPASPLLIEESTNSEDFTYSNTTANTYTLTASATGLTSAVQSVTVNPAGVAIQLAFITITQTTTAGTPTGTMTIQLQDGLNNPVNAGAGGQVVYLTSNSTGTVTFTPAALLTIASGTSSVSFTYTDTKSGAATITASDSSPLVDPDTGLTDATQIATVNPGTAAQVKVVNATEANPGTTNSISVDIEVQDANGNTQPTHAAYTATVAVTGSGAVFGSPISLPSGIGIVTIAVNDIVAEVVTVSLSETSGTTLTELAGTATFIPGPAAQVVVMNATESAPGTANSVTMTIQIRDTNGNAQSSHDAYTATVGVTGSASVVGSPISISNGAAATTITVNDTLVEAVTVSLTETSLTTLTEVSGTATFIAGPPAKFVFTVVPASTNAGVPSGTFTVQLQDSFNNPSNAGGGGQLVYLTSTSTGTVSFTPASPLTITSGSTSANFTYTDSLIGTPMITAADTSPATPDTGLTNATTTINVTPSSPTVAILKTTSTASASSGGQATYTITVTNTGLGPATEVTVSDPLPTGLFYATTTSITGNNTRDSVTDPAYGASSPTWGTFTIPATSGTLVITFTANVGCSTGTGIKDNSPSVSGTNFTTVIFDGAGSSEENVTVAAGGTGTMTVNATADNNTRDAVLTLREAIMLSEGTLSKSSALPLGEWNQVAGCPGGGFRYD